MIFNFWRKYPNRKPKESGYYLCTTNEEHLFFYDNSINFVHTLFYDKRKNTWIDISRKTVFEGYVVYKVCRAPIEENHVYSDSLCERKDVIAWKKLPVKYKEKKKHGKQ